MTCQRHGFGSVLKRAASFWVFVGVEPIHEPSADDDDAIRMIRLHPVVKRIRVPTPDFVKECVTQALSEHVMQAVEDLEDGGVRQPSSPCIRSRHFSTIT